MKLIVITPEKEVADELEIAGRLLADGLDFLHIRKPSFAVSDYRNYINAIDSKYHAQLVIHGCFELYNELRLGGIHLNTAARNDQAVWTGIGDVPASCLSSSFHSWQEILESDVRYRYVFISPVFDSISKVGYNAGIDLRGAAELKRQLKMVGKYCPEILGLGGVDADKIKLLADHGFDGAAMLGAVWNSKDPVASFRLAIDQVRALAND